MKKMLVVLVCFCMFLATAEPVAAVGVSPAPTPTPAIGHDSQAIPSSERQVVPSISGGFSGAREATQEQMEKARQQSASKPIAEMPSITALTDSNWNYLDPFTYYAQQQWYTCGPACVRMILKYKTGSTPSEAVVIAGCNTDTTHGTYLSDMVNYVNTVHMLNYSSEYSATSSQLMSNIWTGITTNSNPCIVGLQESTSNGWGFDLARHFIIIYSVRTDLSEVSLCDPWAHYVSATGPYWYVCKTDAELYSAYSAVNLGMMY